MLYHPQTFLQTLRDEPAVEVLVCDGEADRALALMGNILKVKRNMHHDLSLSVHWLNYVLLFSLVGASHQQ